MIARRSSGPGPTGKASSRRSSSCATVARSISPSASTSRRTGPTSALPASGTGATSPAAPASSPRCTSRRRRTPAWTRSYRWPRRPSSRSCTDELSVAPAVSDRDRDPRAAPRVAIIARQGKFLVAEPFFGAGPRLAISRDKRYDVGDLVELSGAQPAGSGSGPGSGSGSGGSGSTRKGGSRRPRVLRRLGRPDVARDVITALMLDRGLDGRFDPAVGRSARDASEREVQAEGRRDLIELETFTIDPVPARDFDDAISAEPTSDGGWRVWVHIADVSFYVPQRSLVDREAYRRATSVYVPGTVEPMLPQSLSNGACSLVPDEVRPTLTVELTIGTRGVRGASIYRSLIRSDERLDYDRVDRIFAGSETAAAAWGEPLAAARAAAGALDALRRGR